MRVLRENVVARHHRRHPTDLPVIGGALWILVIFVVLFYSYRGDRFEIYFAVLALMGVVQSIFGAQMIREERRQPTTTARRRWLSKSALGWLQVFNGMLMAAVFLGFAVIFSG